MTDKLKKQFPTPISKQGTYNPNLEIIANGNFVYEGFGCNRFLRYTGELKTYEQVRHSRTRTHNIDFFTSNDINPKFCMYIENNSSKEIVISYSSAKDLLKIAEILLGKENATLIEL